MRYVVAILLFFIVISGCAKKAIRTTSMATEAYQARPELEGSLFKSDQEILGEEAIKTILSSKLVLPQKAKIALMKFPGAGRGASGYYGYYYWRSENYIRTQQEYIDTMSSTLSKSNRVSEVTLLPSLLTPKDSTIPVLREAAVRLQADLLLVFRIASDIYHQPKIFAKDKVKAYSICEAVLLDVRTGLIPFTTVVTEEKIEHKEKEDLEIKETMKRAENAAVLDSLNIVASKLVAFLNAVP